MPSLTQVSAEPSSRHTAKVAPLDRVTTLLQAGSECAVAKAGPLAGCRILFEQGGLSALFRGNSANVVKSIPEIGVKMLTFEASMASRSSQAEGQQLAATVVRVDAEVNSKHPISRPCERARPTVGRSTSEGRARGGYRQAG